MPTHRAKKPLSTPTPREVRRPYMIAESMSRPWPSVPSQYVTPVQPSAPGGRRLSMMSSWARSYGFCGASHGAKTATTMMTSSTAAPTIATGLSQKSETIRRHGPSTGPEGPSTGTAATASGSWASTFMP